jgi:phospholipase C
MDTRREFFKKAAMLAGGASAFNALLPAIERAAAILPPEESTYLDAEHVVILMQENRSFDHLFGTLRGVRGFNDPRAVTLPDQNPVWLQTNASGDVYPPFRLDARRTNATWLGSLPHSWSDQNDAKNGGDHDKWLLAKPTEHKDCAGMPLTMGYYSREDLPFYYALADAFTICDQHFCSSLTGTTPNRLYLWTGTIREQQHAESPANVLNENVDCGMPARWKTFPERLEDAGVSWKIYQNDLSIASGLSKEEDAWLASFGDNPIEWFPQFAVQFAKTHCDHIERLAATLPAAIEGLQKHLNSLAEGEERTKIEAELNQTRALLHRASEELEAMRGASLDRQPERTRNLHAKAFTTNSGDPDYRTLTALRYQDGTAKRELQIPKGDILHQFRKDVNSGNLPAVSWIVAPEKFSDHPTAPWYGAWYVAEVINILTHDPEVWKKTIFVLTYDENDGFFDHVPPFGAPDPGRPETGSVSAGIDAGVEYVTIEQSLRHEPAEKARGGSIGLGFRVPLLVASPWSRGGAVCSQVFDHTSVLQFLEKFASHKTGQPIKETNISEWRRTVCGDLTSLFQPPQEQPGQALPFPEKVSFLEDIHRAQFRNLPDYATLSPQQIDESKRNPRAANWMPRQEPGIRPSCALPYELHAAGRLSVDRQSLHLTLAARNERFGERAAGAPFHVYAPERYLHKGLPNRTRSYAVKAGQSLEDTWQLAGFADGRYHLCVCGPNGFLYELAGAYDDPPLELNAGGPKQAQGAELRLSLANQHADIAYTALITHHAYGLPNQEKVLQAGSTAAVVFDLRRSFGWYDFSVRVAGFDHFERRYSGRVETGRPTFSDPAMGGVKV